MGFVPQMGAAMIRITEWFCQNQTPGGDFAYERYVKTGRKTGRYNIVRQAGSLYALTQFSKIYKDDRLAETIEKGFAFFKRVRKMKNNGYALLLVALVEHMESDPRNEKRFLGWAKRIANHLASTQKSNGGFRISSDPEKESDYNNGETFYALIRMYLLTGRAQYLRPVKKAAHYFYKKYPAREFNGSFFSWGLAGFAYLYQREPNVRHWKYMKGLSDTFLKKRGGMLSKKPRGGFGVFLEGLCHTAWIVKKKNPAYFWKLKLFIERALKYLLSLQLDGPTSKRHTHFGVLRGAICYDFLCKTIRVDITHHNLSALYLYRLMCANDGSAILVSVPGSKK